MGADQTCREEEVRQELDRQGQAGAEVVVEPVVSNITSTTTTGAEVVVEENKTERKKEQERRNQAARGSQDGASGTSEFYKSMSIVEARKELERMEKENKEKQE